MYPKFIVMLLFITYHLIIIHYSLMSCDLNFCVHMLEKEKRKICIDSTIVIETLGYLIESLTWSTEPDRFELPSVIDSPAEINTRPSELICRRVRKQ